ncbi:MAG: hypothetical protein CMG67_00905 [Candidatus Marinimicrobia bacterium]|nr:hypothetical protein [Candidatus Neomarinimicrobiota bacterium]|tara:strand:+ start:4718 stop:5413 length:696 start_codon:yes stop_codon:yes gene_type:complete
MIKIFNLSLLKAVYIIVTISLSNFLIISNSVSDEKKEIIKLVNIKLNEIGEFQEPKSYPEGFLKSTARKCKNKKFYCIQQKAVKEMSLRFKRSKKYNLKNPGNQIYAMAHFEIFYLNKLRKEKENIEKFKKSWPEKKVKAKNIVSLIKLNESRKIMREALGMNLQTNIDVALDTYWTIADFLQQGVIKEHKVDKNLILRGKVLDDYKSTVNKLKRTLETQKLKKIYDYLES